MNILLLRGFNNYFNRTVKKYTGLIAYMNASASYLDLANINFNPNDGITTELILGSTDQKENSKPLDWESIGTPDYAICYEMENNVTVTKSRWFVLESERTRTGQYRLALKRDVIADNLNKVMTAPCFVEKGIINNNSDPLLFNNENVSFNQIKQSEVPLKDASGCGWIVGYVSQDKTRYPASGYYESTSPVATVEDWDEVPEALQDLIALGTFQRPVQIANTSWGTPAGRCRIQGVNWKCATTPKYQGIAWSNVPWAGEATAGYQAPQTTNPPYTGNLTLNGTGFALSAGNTEPVAAATFANAIRYNATLRTYYVNHILTNGVDFDSTVQNEIESWDGRFVEKDGVVYKIKYTAGSRMAGEPWDLAASDATNYGAFTTEWNSFKTAHANEVFFRDGSNTINTSSVYIASNGTVQLVWEIYEATVSLEETTADDGYILKSYIPATRVQACDTPMDIFAIPYSDEFKVWNVVDAETGTAIGYFTCSKQIGLQAAISLAQAGANVYDIQILPYFPNPDLFASGDLGPLEFIPTGTTLEEDKHYNYIKNVEDTTVGIIFWSRTSTFTVDINAEVSLADTNPLTLKTSNSCDLFRLTSPNYAGSFEFSLAKSGGRITKFNADCTYKPYNPYIHVTPYLSGLYGENFNTIDDARGLICGGDFSITKVVNQWQQYELQNKNYQQIFDRQIQNLDVGQQIEREQFEFNTYQNLANMGVAPLSVGGIASYAKTSLVSPIFTTTGAVKEGDWLRRQQSEARNYALDMYSYQLGNIKALPNSLAKTSALTNNNKIFPFVEYFTCTQAEKDAFKDKLKYNGMTIMKIADLNTYSVSSDFDKVFVKGQIIRLDDIADDFHVADAIYQEVNKGLYIPQ